MAWEYIADFRAPLGATDEDRRWGALAIGFAKGLVEIEPRIRFRIRNLPQGLYEKPRSFEEWAKRMGVDLSDPQETAAARESFKEVRSPVGEHGRKAITEQPISLDSNDVPEVLRPRIEIPRAGQFWVRNYQCMECADPRTGKIGLWVPHIRRKLHSKGQPLVFPPPALDGESSAGRVHRSDPKKGDVRMKGIRSTWIPTHQLIMASPARLRANRTLTSLRYSVAVTSAPDDPSWLDGFHAVVLVPLRKADHAAEAARIRAALPEVESVVVLPSRPAEGIRALLAALLEIDSGSLEEPRDDADDAADVLLRVADARGILALDPGSASASADLVTALADLVGVVPERAREVAREAAAASTAPDSAVGTRRLAVVDDAVERVKALLDPELVDQISRDRSARQTVSGMVEAKRGLPAKAPAPAVVPGAAVVPKGESP